MINAMDYIYIFISFISFREKSIYIIFGESMEGGKNFTK
jgi:hypothetical protein